MEAVLEFLDRADGDDWGIEDIRVTRAGIIGRRERGKPIRFAFRCFDVPVRAEARMADGSVDLELAAVIGAVPFTAEAADARKRTRGKLGVVGRCCRFALTTALQSFPRRRASRWCRWR